MSSSHRNGASLISHKTRSTLKHAKRLALVYGLCLVLLSSVTPVFGQRRTAIRVSSSEASPKTGKSEREKEKPRTTAAKSRARTNAGALNRAQKQIDEKGYTVGLPWTGQAGVGKTTAHIMSEQAYAPVKSGRPMLVPEHHIPGRRTRPQDPKAKAASSFPASSLKVASRESTKISLAPQTLGTNFNAVTGPTETGAFPPDTMGDIGPSQYFLFVNGRLRTFNKDTGLADGVVNVDPDVFFASVMTPPPPPLSINFTTDPQVRYDRLSARWFLVIIDVPSANDIGDSSNRVLIAVSDAASAGVISPATIWTFYFIQQDTVGGIPSTGQFCDYESLGVDKDALYIGGDMFNAAAGTFENTSVFVVRKSSILSGGPMVVTAFRDLIGTDGPFDPRGVDNYDPASTEGFFIGVSAAAFGRLVMRRIATPGATPAISANISITVTSTSYPIPVDHLGNTDTADGGLDALDDRLFAAHIRNGRLWTSHNIAVTAAGAASNTNGQRRNAVRWYELIVPPTTGTPTVNQSGTIFDPATSRADARQFFIPSLMVSGQGHAALGFSTAGSPFFADAATNGRLVGDALGTLGAVNIYTASSSAYNPPGDPGGPARRWGDYSSTSLDPFDDMTMWTVQQYTNATNTYGARVVKLIAPPPATPALAAPSTVADEDPSEDITITGTSVAGSGFYDPGTDLAPPALPFNHISVGISGGVTVNNVTYTNPTSLTINVSTVGATPGLQTVTVTNPDGQSLGGAVLTVTSPGTAAPLPGQVLINEFRFRGPSSAEDEFVELYNNTNTDLDISGCTLWALTGAGAQNLRFTVPGAVGSNTTVIPARSHYLITGASYSLAGSAASNGVLSAGIVDGSGIAFFAGATTATTRIDSAGFESRNALFFEGTPIAPSGAGTGGITVAGEYAFFRKLTTGLPQDSGDNNADFAFVSITGGTFSTRASTLGAPGPENLTGPIQRNTTIKASVVDTGAPSNSAPNRVRDVASYTDTLTPSAPNGGVPASNPYTNGTLSIRRKFTNNTGGPVTRLRFRIVDTTTFPPPGGVADLRGLSSSTIVVSLTGGGSATVRGLTLEQVPIQAMGGGLNSTLSAGTVTMGTPIAAGANINVQFLLGVVTGGTFRFFINVEALP